MSTLRACILSFTLLPIGVASAARPPAQAAAATLDPAGARRSGWSAHRPNQLHPVVFAAPIRGRGSCPSGLHGVSLRLAHG